jgi:ABC-type transporter Mla subunit MlaD
MPATKKTAVQAELAEDDARRLERVSALLETAQKDLGAVGGSLGTGVHDLRRDVTRLLRDARRDLLKMRRALQRDLERLHRDLTAAATAKPPVSRRPHAPARRPAKPTSRRPVASAR